MHLGWPVPTVPIPTSRYLCQPYFNHTSLTIFPMHLIPMWAATLINIKSCAVTRSLTLNLLIWLLDHQKQFKVFLNSQKYQIVLLVVLSICEVTQGNVQILIYIFNCWTAQHFCVALYLGEMLLNLDLTIRLFFTKMNPDYIRVSASAWYFVRILIKLKRVGPTLYSDPRGRLWESNDWYVGDVPNPAPRCSAALNARVRCRI